MTIDCSELQWPEAMVASASSTSARRLLTRLRVLPIQRPTDFNDPAFSEQFMRLFWRIWKAFCA